MDSSRMSYTTAMSDRAPPQDIYARHLSSSRGYPLWTPEPSNELLMQRPEGLAIGDVGVVLEDGGVDVLFNLCLPADHPFHRHGVPKGFTCVDPRRLDIRTITNAEPPRYVISSSSVTPVKTSGSSNDVSERHDSNALPSRFDLSSSEGAVLVLPKGAERYDLLNEEIFLEQASQHGAAWYDYALNRRGRIISPDSLYLITGVHKTIAWSAAVFENASANEHHTAYFRQIERNNHPPTYSWETNGTCAMEWRVAPETGPHIEYSIPNQAVFIRGFKIAIRSGLLGTRWVSVEADSPSTRSKSVKLSSLVPSSSPVLGRLAEFLDVFSSSGSSYFPTTTRSEGTIDADEERPQSNTNRGGYDGTHVKIQRVPDVPRPFHPSDAINRYLLEKDPSANIAITHDSHWISLLEDNSLTQEELGDESSVETALSQNYQIVSREGVVYLEKKSSQPTGSPPPFTFEQKATPEISPQSSPSPPLLFADDVDPSLDGDNKMISVPVLDDNIEEFDRPPSLAYPISQAPLSRIRAWTFQEMYPSLNPYYSSLLSYPGSMATYQSLLMDDDPKQHHCRWITNGLPCDTPVLGRDILGHLHTHAVRDGHDATLVHCQWDGCGEEFRAYELLTLHVLECHFNASEFDMTRRHTWLDAPMSHALASVTFIPSLLGFSDSGPSHFPHFPTNDPTKSIDDDPTLREYRCRWITDGLLCDDLVRGRDISEHLHSSHAIRDNHDAQNIRCHWDGCDGLFITGSSLIRHVREGHFHLACDTTIRHRTARPLYAQVQPARETPFGKFNSSRQNPLEINDLTQPIVDDPEGKQYHCRWITNGLPCDAAVLGRELPAHLHIVHGVHEDADTIIRCRWGDCAATVRRMNFIRHIREIHLGHRRQSDHRPTSPSPISPATCNDLSFSGPGGSARTSHCSTHSHFAHLDTLIAQGL